MIHLRRSRLDDLEGLFELAKKAKAGITTLPADRILLQERLVAVDKAFENKSNKPGMDSYLFILEDLSKGKIIGTSGIASKIGGYEPHWTYELKEQSFNSETLRTEKIVRYLKLKANHNGPSEIGTLFLDPDERGGPWGRFLSLSRFLFISAYKECFESEVIAEMRGEIDDNKSVFWECLGKHFFEMDFEKADRLSMRDKHFIAELMPTHPIYVPLLPIQAQEVIGKVHSNTKPALSLLEKEGFKFNQEVDIFEAGPVVSCPTDKIRSVRESVFSKCMGVFEPNQDDKPMMIANLSSFESFSVTLGKVKEGHEQVEVSQDCFESLKFNKGDDLLYCPLYPKE